MRQCIGFRSGYFNLVSTWCDIGAFRSFHLVDIQ
uniref:Uncharacterized protein n=1 Tax=Rhizophora mucronata TaxID=61149 RepID=A0A2P2IZ04_RHIMU